MLTSTDYELFISSISHEIRNPITLLNSYLQLLAAAYPEVTSYPQWQPIQNEMSYLCHLLDDISTFHNGEKLHLTYTDSQLWLSDYVLTAKELIQQLAPTDTLFTVHLAESLPSLPIDQIKIRQLLDNLIRNSTEAAVGSNTITFSAHFQDQNLIIQVSDTGCGIKKEDLSSIFLPFVTHKSEGTGLGLAISKRIALAHHGDLSVQSEPGSGSTFTLRIPTG